MGDVSDSIDITDRGAAAGVNADVSPIVCLDLLSKELAIGFDTDADKHSSAMEFRLLARRVFDQNAADTFLA